MFFIYKSFIKMIVLHYTYIIVLYNQNHAKHSLDVYTFLYSREPIYTI